MVMFNHKHLVSIKQLSVEDIYTILDAAESLKEISGRDIKKVPILRGKNVVLFFNEPSTRTRTSFEIAAKRLSADVVGFSTKGSSTTKGETLIDTVRNIQAMSPDLIVMRHYSSGVPYMLARKIDIGIINAGDGINEHPTQALLDLYTIREKKGRIEGLKVVIIGDIEHSRVARSEIYALTKLGAQVTLSGPPTMMPVQAESMGVQVMYHPGEAIQGQDVIILLRIQMERHSKCLFPGLREYSSFFGMNKEILKYIKEGAIIMHPGPVNRGVEASPDVMDGPFSVVLDQVANGVAVRMALLCLFMGGNRD
ncbi:MAG: aspartate carbamoyltransferase catalytic subunit [Deltaproteobacteria bacterium]|nr:aspartate carbamoyltransferase catalytic subunit [Deltaproteobacteria bacterium]